MDKDRRVAGWLLIGLIFLLAVVFLAACSPASRSATTSSVEGVLALPDLQPLELAGEPLRVVATTSIIGDVVRQIGGDTIALTTLMAPGQDPHSFEPAVQDLVPVADADVIFVNGWHLEETLVDNLEEIAKEVPLVPISANLEPLPFNEGESAEEEHETAHGADPHTWFSIANVKQWVKNTVAVLSALDPDHAQTYAKNGADYLAELDDLEAYTEAALAPVAQADRVLVTNHDSLSYFARDYGFTVLDTVIPAASTLAEPSAGQMAALVEQMQKNGVCTIITETTVSDSLARTVAEELDHCDKVRVLPIHTGALGPAGSGADSYIGLYRSTVDAIVEAVR